MDKGVVENQGITFRGFAIDPQSSDIVYAAAEISSWLWAGEERSGLEFDMTKGVVYKTTDGGQNWTAVWRGDNLARYVWIDPRDPEVVYVSTGIFDREAANSDPTTGTAGGVGVIKSTDGGQTWSQATNGLMNTYVGSLFMHPQDPDILLAGTGNNQYQIEDGVYLSTFGPAPGSLEGMLYTVIPISQQLTGWLEVVPQALLLSVILFYWINHPEKRWLDWLLVAIFIVMLLLQAMGLLATAMGIA